MAWYFSYLPKFAKKIDILADKQDDGPIWLGLEKAKRPMVQPIEIDQLSKLPKEVGPLLIGGYYTLHTGTLNNRPFDGYVLRLQGGKFALLSANGEIDRILDASDTLQILDDIPVLSSNQGATSSAFLEQLKRAVR